MSQIRFNKLIKEMIREVLHEVSEEEQRAYNFARRIISGQIDPDDLYDYRRDEPEFMRRVDAALRDLQSGSSSKYGSSSRRYSRMPRPSFSGKTLYFYNVPSGKEDLAKMSNLRQTKSGKWYTVGTPSDSADKEFGPGRPWSPSN